eukprot:NODE_1164_length_1930_cov_0.974331.p2 type:complete len:113 gc:universal NODE_1164_length_1930_cov_0.974331:1328-1666(+)
MGRYCSMSSYSELLFLWIGTISEYLKQSGTIPLVPIILKYLNKNSLKLSVEQCKNSFMTPSTPADFDFCNLFKISLNFSNERLSHSLESNWNGRYALCSSPDKSHLSFHLSK